MIQKNYRPISYFINKYGFGKSYFNSLLTDRKVSYVKSSEGARALRLICENEFIAYLESNRVPSDSEIQAKALAV